MYNYRQHDLSEETIRRFEEADRQIDLFRKWSLEADNWSDSDWYFEQMLTIREEVFGI